MNLTSLEILCDTYRVKHKQTTIKTPISECNTGTPDPSLMICTSEINMVDSVANSGIDAVLTNTLWDIHFTYHTVLRAFPGIAVFELNILFDTVHS